MHLPLSEPVLIFGLATFLFLVVPLVFERFRIPGLIGLILAGALVGPNGLGLLARDETIILFGHVGLLYLMFMVGLELDLNEFKRNTHHSVIFGLLSFALPQALGTGLSLLLGYGLGPSVLLGAMFASHTLVAYPVASRLGIVKTGAVTTVLGATLLTDMLSLTVLAVVTGAREGVIGPVFWATLVGSLALYVAIVLWGVPRLGRWFFRNVRAGGPAEFLFTLAMLFVFASLAHLMGIEPIIGALLTGFALNQLIPENSALMSRIKLVAESVFVPFFLLSVGMLVDVRAFADPDAWTIIIALVLAIFVAKGLAAKITQRLFGYSSAAGWTMLGLSVSHAAATMAITLVGYELGIFDQTIVNAVVVIILVTCLVGPWLVQKFGREVALAEEYRPYEPTEAPRRILVPLSNPETEEGLLDLAILVRGADSDEPLHPLTVVRERGDGTDAEVAEAETMLDHAVIYAAGAEVPASPLTRVDRNTARGITRGITETRSSSVIIGWNPEKASQHVIFGSTLDQLLERTKQLVLVAKLGHPLNTTRRLVLVLPSAIDHHPGFLDAVRTIKRIASQLDAPIEGLVVDGSAEHYRSHYEDVEPDVPITFEALPGWQDLLPDLRRRLRPEDLVVVMSARRGTLPWRPTLERLPKRLAHLGPESFVIVYPSQVRPAGPADFTETVLPRALRPERVVFDLAPMPFEDALRELLDTAFADDPERLERIASTLVHNEHEFSSEIRPGVVVPHARIARLSEPMMFLGNSPEGIDFPRADAPARLIFLLLSPAEHTQEHLRNLSRIAGLVSQPERVQDLLRSQTTEALFEAFKDEEPREVGG